jgi:hypothetical protein
VTYYALEARFSPWWIPRTEAEATREALGKEQLTTSAPPLWALVVAVALTVPIILAP